MVKIRVIVHNGDLEHAIRTLKRKVQREGISRKIKVCYFEKPCERLAKKRAESKRRRRKLELKKLRFED